ncbi:MAG TPA: S46 family peptidase [Verrucomicrobiae bacterium]
MRSSRFRLASYSGLLFFHVSLLAATLQADEGMWLYNHPPRELIRQRYGFDLDPAWLEHLQKASVRFGNGGSAEFVSEEGLVLSNHHVGSGALQRLSTAELNYVRDGFYARTRAEEKPCPGIELKVLMEIEDVTERVNAAVGAGAPDDAAFKARRAAIAAIEKESLDKTGLHSEVVTLYQGALYHLYRFKKYTDVRLVFAPEEQIAFYGGDPDNFEYPRYDLDICLFRAYENGKPAKVQHYLRWSKAGAPDNELVFVSGNPGRTDRLRTVAELEFLRDIEYPRTLQRLNRLEVLLGAFGARSAENARRARGDLFGVRNSRKVRTGALAGLLDPKLMGPKQTAEAQFKAAIHDRSGLSDAEAAWDRIAEAQKIIAQNSLRYDMLERGYGFASPLFTYARQLWRVAEEQSKPNGERLEEFRESARSSFENALFAEQPIYNDLETLKLTDSLTWLAEELGYDDILVQHVLAGRSPRDRAGDLVRNTRLGSAKVRRELYRGGRPALEEAKDPMLELAATVDPAARAVRKLLEPQREAIRQAHARIGKARFALYGRNDYPDATSSLRLAFGLVKGYAENGQKIPFETTFAGLYERAAAQNYRPPFDLPQSWIARKRKLKLDTPFNFVCTADIIGGNSGSPVVNRKGELVGVIFDGNIQSLTADFAYSDEQCRALAVHSSGIIEALSKIYRARELVAELTKGESR